MFYVTRFVRELRRTVVMEPRPALLPGCAELWDLATSRSFLYRKVYFTGGCCKYNRYNHKSRGSILFNRINLWKCAFKNVSILYLLYFSSNRVSFSVSAKMKIVLPLVVWISIFTNYVSKQYYLYIYYYKILYWRFKDLSSSWQQTEYALLELMFAVCPWRRDRSYSLYSN